MRPRDELTADERDEYRARQILRGDVNRGEVVRPRPRRVSAMPAEPITEERGIALGLRGMRSRLAAYGMPPDAWLAWLHVVHARAAVWCRCGGGVEDRETLRQIALALGQRWTELLEAHESRDDHGAYEALCDEVSGRRAVGMLPGWVVYPPPGWTVENDTGRV